MLLRENVPLAPLTTLGVGGPARYFCEAQREDDVREAVAFARAKHLRLFVMGGGSNLVFRDTGFHGLVLKIALNGIEDHTGPQTRVSTAGAGVEWDAFVAHTVAENYGGLECLSGIPGSVGGTPIQNVGAYGQEVSDSIVSVRAYDTLRDETVSLSKEDCEFSYRCSLFNTDERGRYIIVSVQFGLHKDAPPQLTYPDLQQYFAERSGAPSLTEARHAILEIRRRKSMVLDPADENSRSAGSFFKNPVLPLSEFNQFAARLDARGLQLPSYATDWRHRKIPAAWLVEHAGFPKGYIKGNAGISTKHTLAIVNRGGATATEIIALKDDIQAKVREQFGIELQPEPVIVGY